MVLWHENYQNPLKNVYKPTGGLLDKVLNLYQSLTINISNSKKSNSTNWGSFKRRLIDDITL